jgi:uncharacterized protein (DUF362 family)
LRHRALCDPYLAKDERVVMNSEIVGNLPFFDCRTVFLAEASAASYEADRIAAAMRDLFHSAGLDEARFGSAEWNPLADVIRPGDRVLLKPNWVLHENRSGGGLDCLVTHPAVIEAALRFVMKTAPASVIVGDAPLQSCDFAVLMKSCGIRDMAARCQAGGPAIDIRDFRLVTRDSADLRARTRPTSRSLDQYVLFDLGTVSALEPVTREDSGFRVTMYDPEGLRSTHAVGTHKYLIARELIESNVVINLPKLKTHRKAGMTGALKNIVGLNGHKQYLPHHRKGGAADKGDCYPGSNRLKAFAEAMLDRGNRQLSPAMRGLCSRAASAALGAGTLFGGDRNVEGAWYGNDTVWRMALDLQMILHYGRSDGTLAGVPQRRVLSITDAIVAGEGEGPLTPVPAPIGVLTLSANTAAADWVNTVLLGLDPARIPLTREAFLGTKYPLASFASGDVGVRTTQGLRQVAEIAERFARKAAVPEGWAGHCEWIADPLERLLVC